MKRGNPSLFLRRFFSVGALILMSVAFVFSIVPPSVWACGLNGGCTNAPVAGWPSGTFVHPGSSLNVNPALSWQKGDLIVGCVGIASSTITATVADNQGDTYTAAVVTTTGSGTALTNYLFFAVAHQNNVGNPSITVTLSSSAPEAGMYFTVFRTASNVTFATYQSSSGTGVSAYNAFSTQIPATGFVFGCMYSAQADTPASPMTGSGNNGGFTYLGHYDYGYFPSPYSLTYSGTFAAATVYAIAAAVFTSSTSPSGNAVQTQTIGSCPPGGGTGIGHYALANNTIYFYNGNALGQEVVNTVSTEVASIKGSGTHYLELLIYASTSTPPSIAFPNTRLYESKVFAITSGTTNNTITLQIGVPLNGAATTPLPFNWWSVGIVGDDHINIAGSSLSGLVTQTGTTPTGASVPPIQPNTFTSSGSASTNKFALCAIGSYQNVAGFIGATTTTTQSASSTVTVTSTNVINTIGPQIFSTTSNWPVIFLILLLPAGLFLGVTKSLAGALLGLGVGAVLGIMMGILPGWVFVGLVISLVAVAFIARERSP